MRKRNKKKRKNNQKISCYADMPIYICILYIENVWIHKFWYWAKFNRKLNQLNSKPYLIKKSIWKILMYILYYFIYYTDRILLYLIILYT